MTAHKVHKFASWNTLRHEEDKNPSPHFELRRYETLGSSKEPSYVYAVRTRSHGTVGVVNILTLAAAVAECLKEFQAGVEKEQRKAARKEKTE